MFTKVAFLKAMPPKLIPSLFIFIAPPAILMITWVSASELLSKQETIIIIGYHFLLRMEVYVVKFVYNIFTPNCSAFWLIIWFIFLRISWNYYLAKELNVTGRALFWIGIFCGYKRTILTGVFLLHKIVRYLCLCWHNQKKTSSISKVFYYLICVNCGCRCYNNHRVASIHKRMFF